jgi:hypothetical protein
MHFGFCDLLQVHTEFDQSSLVRQVELNPFSAGGVSQV